MVTQKKGTPEPQLPEELVSTSTGTTMLNGSTFAGKELTYAAVDDLAIFEGDIVLGRASEMPEARAVSDIAYAVVVMPASMRWPNAQVPYEIDSGMPDQHRVVDAIAHWEANTPIRFILRTAANAGQYPNYVRFFAGTGCYSAVGMLGGRQDISLGANCSTGNAIHEIGHAVGLWHEQSREDRDTWVSIVWANIDPAKAHNFNQHISDGDDVGAYDYGSIMHYPPTAFSVNGQATIVPTQPGVTIGQRTGLSAGDIAAIREIYPVPDPFKAVRDNRPTRWKNLRDGQVVVQPKKLRDDIVVQPKKLLDDGGVRKRIGDAVPVPMPLPYPFGQLDVAELLPFILSTPHHAASAAAYQGAGYGDETGQAVDLLTQLAEAAAAAQAASAALADAALAINAFLDDGSSGVNP